MILKVFIGHLERLAAQRLHVEAQTQVEVVAPSKSVLEQEVSQAEANVANESNIQIQQDVRPSAQQVEQVVKSWIDEGERSQGHSRIAAMAVVAQVSQFMQ